MVPASLTDKQDKAFAAHISDLFETARQKHTTRFTGFLDMHQLSVAKQMAAGMDYRNYLFFGGYPDGERVMLGVFSQYDDPNHDSFPVVPITAAFRKEDEIGHRDILGSLMGFQLKREAVGDILTDAGRAVFFVTEPAAPVVLSELTQIGRCGVKLARGLPSPMPVSRRYEEMELNVSSLRVDCIVSAVTGVSREKSAQAVRSQTVFVNGALLAEISRTICQGDVVSIRGFGKFVFDRVNRVTKKGRLQILCRKYV